MRRAMSKLGHKPWQARCPCKKQKHTPDQSESIFSYLSNQNSLFDCFSTATSTAYGNNPQLFFVFHSPLPRTVARHQTNSYWTNNHIQSMYAMCFERGTYSSVCLSIKLCLDILFVNVLSVLALFCASFATCCVSTHIPSHMRMNTYSKPYLRHATIIKYNLLHDCTPYCIWNFFLNCFGGFDTHCFFVVCRNGLYNHMHSHSHAHEYVLQTISTACVNRKIWFPTWL